MTSFPVFLLWPASWRLICRIVFSQYLRGTNIRAGFWSLFPLLSAPCVLTPATGTPMTRFLFSRLRCFRCEVFLVIDLFLWCRRYPPTPHPLPALVLARFMIFSLSWVFSSLTQNQSLRCHWTSQNVGWFSFFIKLEKKPAGISWNILLPRSSFWSFLHSSLRNVTHVLLMPCSISYWQFFPLCLILKTYIDFSSPLRMVPFPVSNVL